MKANNIRKIEKHFRRGEWKKTRELIYRELKKKPKDHWLLTRLAMTYYEETEYKRALSISEKAMKLAPTCPLVLWDYACALDMIGSHKKAIAGWKKLLKKGVEAVAYREHGEGLRWARSLLNDCRYRTGLSYGKQGKVKLALKYLRQHLANRSLLVPSIYKLGEVKKQISRFAK